MAPFVHRVVDADHHADAGDNNNLNSKDNQDALDVADNVLEKRGDFLTGATV